MDDLIKRLAIAFVALVVLLVFFDKVYTGKYNSMEIIHREPLSTAVFFGLLFNGICHLIG